ncbi:glycerate kinase [Alkalihalobacillus trypoxylicola]|uniref:Glycerate kinase n=1 Tax=Alkalihalobacillus trypoxylicola TaxID=519424 RepID=A0A162D1N5_9BACI|nr:glycerate kinase [Alkalihalobacillus trypoxylicola]KYG27738.1 glycerate kinase [Alkalihalobacillus trypoxylicola]
MSIKKIVIAPDSFKESMTAKQAAEAVKRGFESIYKGSVSYELIPMADGGEGTTQSLADSLQGSLHEREVTGPLGDKVIATYAISGDGATAIIEMAEASGLALVSPQDRNPLKTTTYGTGELIKAALEHGVSNIILGIGGSATNDGGAGMIEALGGRLYTKNKQLVTKGGAALQDLIEMDLTALDSRLKKVNVLVACDVDNPLLGPSGASAIYGPQKGATPKMVKQLDQALENFHNVMEKATGKDVKSLPGSGAAGGIGAGLLACLGATLKPGIDIVLEQTNFAERVANADLVITGEGKIDNQTIYGKTPIGVAKAAKKHSEATVIALCGTLGNGHESVFEHGIDAAFSIVQGPCNIEEAIQQGPVNVEATARNIAQVMKMLEK